MKYSIVCTVYNDEDNIESFIENLIHQDPKPNEIIVVDGGSSDKTLMKLHLTEKKYSCVKLVQKGRMNISQGLNEGVRHVENEVFGIAAVGNRYDPLFFRELLSTIDEGYDIAYAPVRGEEKSSFQRLYSKTFLKSTIGDGIRSLSNHGVLMKKSAYEKMGLFCENFIYAGEDAEYYGRVSKCGLKSKCNEKAILYWDTPRNMVEFNRQTRLYCIADIQMRAYNRTIRDFLVLIGFLFGGAICALYMNGFFSVFGSLALLFLSCCIRKRCCIGSGFLLFLRIILRSYYVIRYLPLFSSKYRVSTDGYET